MFLERMAHKEMCDIHSRHFLCDAWKWSQVNESGAGAGRWMCRKNSEASNSAGINDKECL